MDPRQAQANLDKIALEQGLTVRYKDEWWLAKILGVLFFWDRTWTQRASVFGHTVLLPVKSTVRNSIAYTLWMAYSLGRASDDRRYGALPVLALSSFPQILAVPAILAILAIWYDPEYLWFLLCLIFALPWPAPGRAWVQMKAYSLLMAAHHWLLGTPISCKPENLQTIFSGTVDRLTGWGYYKMIWRRKKAVVSMGLRLRYGGTLTDTARRIKKALTDPE